VIWGNVPQRNKNFTGRDDILGILRQGLSRRVTAVLPHALQGMGGVGKTAIAVEYAHRYKYEYELIWWVPADQPALVQSSLASLADRLGLSSATTTGTAGAAAATLDALRRGEPYKHWLLIFDNADQPEDLNDVIPQGPGDVLITSRNHRWQAVVETVQVDVFSRPESVQFLNKRVPGGLSEADAESLADELGDLPLALEQAGALQAETGMTVDEYLRLLENHVAAVMSEGQSLDYPLPMTAAWKLSVQTLDKSQPQAVRLLRCCAFFGVEPIPRDLLPRGAQSLTDPALSDLLSDPIKLARAIGELGRFALIRIEGRTIIIHRLIQALLRDELDEEERDFYREQAYLILSEGAPRNAEDNRLWPRYSELVAHAQSTGLERSANPEVRRFALDLVRYLYVSGDLESAHSFVGRLIEAWADSTDPADRQMLIARQQLGNVRRALGHYGPAFAIDSETLGTAREALGEDDPITLIQISSYVADLRARGDFSQALELDLDALERHRRVLGYDNPVTLQVSHNLAVDYGLNSQYLKSRDQHQETYRRRSESTVDISAAGLLSSWGGLARALRLCGDYTEACDVGQDAYDFGLTELGANHPQTLETAIDLSAALRRTGLTNDDALELAQDVYQRSRRRFGPSAPLALASSVSLSNILRTTGRAVEALDLARDTAEQYQGIFGPDHPYYYGTLGNVALAARMTQDVLTARDLDEEAFVGLRLRLGVEHHYTLTVAVNLASDCAESDNPVRAREIGEDALPRLRSVLGEDHQLTLNCASNLVIDLRACDAAEEADRLYADTLRRYEQILGPDHPDTVTAAAGGRIEPDFDSPQPLGHGNLVGRLDYLRLQGRRNLDRTTQACSG
jgi:hypothetical protein